MGRSKARQLELDKAQATRAVEYLFENIMWREYEVEQITNAGGFEQTEFAPGHVLLHVYNLRPENRRYPSAESLNETIVNYNVKYLEALNELRRLGQQR